MKKNIPIFCGLLLLTLLSCKKKGDEIAPVIDRFELSSATVEELGELTVSGSVSDESQITSLKVVISRISGGFATPVQIESIPVKGKSFSFNQPIEISFEGLTTGDYDVLLEVSDGENSTTEILVVQITELPRGLLGIHFLEGDNKVWYVDSTNTKVLLPIQASGIKFGVHNAAKQELVLLEQQGKQLSSYSSTDQQIEWTSQVVTQFDEVNDQLFYKEEKQVYLANMEGRIKAFNSLGMQVLASPLISNAQLPRKIACTENYILAYSTPFNQVGGQLEVLNRSGGNLFYSIPFTGTMVSMLSMPDNEVICVTQTGQSYTIILYRLESNQQTNLSSGLNLPNAEIFFADSSKALIRTNTGIYLFNMLTLNLSTLLTASDITAVAIHEVGGYVLYCRQGALWGLTVGGNTSIIYNLGFEAKAIWPRYNKF